MRKMLIPIDGSEGSILALKKGMDLAKKTESEITLLYVVTDVTEDVPNMEELELDYQEELDKLLNLACKKGEDVMDEAREILKSYDGEVKTVIKSGNPGKEIIEYANEGKYDLVVMGNRGLSAFSRVMLGSVSNRVMNHVKTSVYVVKE